MKISVLIILAALLSGCVSIKSKSRLPSELQGDFVTLIDMFVVAEDSGSYALALPDSEFSGTKHFTGAPSGHEWIANRERYPHVIDIIPPGASLKFTHAVRESGFSLWFGFVSSQTIMAEVEGYPHVLNAHDLFLYSCKSDRTLNERFTKKNQTTELDK